MDLREKEAAAAVPPTADARVARRLLGAESAQKPPRLPRAIYFPLVVVLSLAWTGVGYSTVAQWTRDELASFAKPVSWSQGVILLGWRVCELGLGWFGNYDSYDLAALSLISHGPTLSLLSAFYHVRPWTTVACLLIDVLSSVVPFALLRPVSAAHSAAPTVPNRILLVDGPIKVYTTFLASAVYAVTLSLSYGAYLRRSLLLNFAGIPSIEPAHSLDATILAVSLTVLFGLAARTFIFEPAAATGSTPEDADAERFDPVSATLGETLRYNAWGFRTQTKVVILRTLVVALTSGLRTFLQCVLTVRGVEPAGAAAFSSVWMAAALLAGAGLGLVME